MHYGKQFLNTSFMKQTIILSIVFCFIISVNSFSQQDQNLTGKSPGKTVAVKGRLTGKVTDAKNGAALPGATIYFPDLKTGAISDNNGVFTTPAINPGRYLI